MIDTLFEAIFLVILVVYLFLQSFRATLICSTAVVVALLGTFPFMLALGFSINLLTLFGLVLAIGIVVDDAIVVVENVERNMSQKHLAPRDATIAAMDEVWSPVIATVLVMASIFIPAAFLPGTTGQLYKQFAITIAISVTISGFVALTLTPALCGVLLSTALRRAAAPSPGSTASSTSSRRPSAAWWCSSSGGWRSRSSSSRDSWPSSSTSSALCPRASCRTRTRAT